jgi:thioesterase domain-containing protein
VVRLRPGDGEALFLFHPVGGSVGCYAELAPAWSGPVYAFQSRALTGPAGATARLDEEPPDLETMAAGYRDELLRLCPDGPLTLGGWSMGGVLAHEVGRQLAARGGRPCTFMIDSELPDGTATGRELARHLAFLTDLAGGRLPADAARVVSGAATGDLARVASDVAAATGLLPAGTGVAGYERLLRIHAHNLGLLARYRPGRSSAPTLLFVASAGGRPDPEPAWRAVCAELEVERWPVDHYSIVAGGRLVTIADRVTRWTAGVRTRSGS